jgi:peptide deformylase
MPVLPIVKEPDARLRQISRPIDMITPEIKQLAQDMMDTMYNENGIGIAAIQVGQPVRMFILDVPRQDESDNAKVVRNPYFVINPVITPLSDKKNILTEGCLSVRGPDGTSYIRGDVERYLSIRLEFTDLDGVKQVLEFDGTISDYDKWSARCAQHEYGHLDGELFTDISQTTWC